MNSISREGFLKVLPLFMDNLFSPALKASEFTTEIHHITERGTNGGVVYAEMSGKQSNMDSIMEIALRKSLYPSGSPYASITGGLLENLRTTCSIRKINDFHSKF
nr:unnamed protein product [Meloidogyne enterolobii]